MSELPLPPPEEASFDDRSLQERLDDAPNISDVDPDLLFNHEERQNGKTTFSSVEDYVKHRPYMQKNGEARNPDRTKLDLDTDHAFNKHVEDETAYEDMSINQLITRATEAVTGDAVDVTTLRGLTDVLTERIDSGHASLEEALTLISKTRQADDSETRRQVIDSLVHRIENGIEVGEGDVALDRAYNVAKASVMAEYANDEELSLDLDLALQTRMYETAMQGKDKEVDQADTDELDDIRLTQVSDRIEALKDRARAELGIGEREDVVGLNLDELRLGDDLDDPENPPETPEQIAERLRLEKEARDNELKDRFRQDFRAVELELDFARRNLAEIMGRDPNFWKKNESTEEFARASAELEAALDKAGHTFKAHCKELGYTNDQIATFLDKGINFYSSKTGFEAEEKKLLDEAEYFSDQKDSEPVSGIRKVGRFLVSNRLTRGYVNLANRNKVTKAVDFGVKVAGTTAVAAIGTGTGLFGVAALGAGTVIAGKRIAGRMTSRGVRAGGGMLLGRFGRGERSLYSELRETQASAQAAADIADVGERSAAMRKVAERFSQLDRRERRIKVGVDVAALGVSAATVGVSSVLEGNVDLTKLDSSATTGQIGEVISDAAEQAEEATAQAEKPVLHIEVPEVEPDAAGSENIPAPGTGEIDPFNVEISNIQNVEQDKGWTYVIRDIRDQMGISEEQVDPAALYRIYTENEELFSPEALGLDESYEFGDTGPNADDYGAVEAGPVDLNYTNPDTVETLRQSILKEAGLVEPTPEADIPLVSGPEVEPVPELGFEAEPEPTPEPETRTEATTTTAPEEQPTTTTTPEASSTTAPETTTPTTPDSTATTTSTTATTVASTPSSFPETTQPTVPPTTETPTTSPETTVPSTTPETTIPAAPSTVEQPPATDTTIPLPEQNNATSTTVPLGEAPAGAEITSITERLADRFLINQGGIETLVDRLNLSPEQVPGAVEAIKSDPNLINEIRDWMSTNQTDANQFGNLLQNTQIEQMSFWSDLESVAARTSAAA